MNMSAQLAHASDAQTSTAQCDLFDASALAEALLWNRTFMITLGHPKFIQRLLETCKTLARTRRAPGGDAGGSDSCTWQFGVQTLLAAGT